MSKRHSLENYALFYEKIETNKQDNSANDMRQEINYEKTAGLNEEQISKLSEDLRNQQKSTKSSSIRT
jgi:hypothetical protein